MNMVYAKPYSKDVMSSVAIFLLVLYTGPEATTKHIGTQKFTLIF